jgi:hypothetical protein
MSETTDSKRLLREFRNIANRAKELWQSSGGAFYLEIARQAEQHIRELTAKSSSNIDANRRGGPEVIGDILPRVVENMDQQRCQPTRNGGRQL